MEAGDTAAEKIYSPTFLKESPPRYTFRDVGDICLGREKVYDWRRRGERLSADRGSTGIPPGGGGRRQIKTVRVGDENR